MRPSTLLSSSSLKNSARRASAFAAKYPSDCCATGNSAANPRRRSSATPAAAFASLPGEAGANTATRAPRSRAFGLRTAVLNRTSELAELVGVIRDGPRREQPQPPRRADSAFSRSALAADVPYPLETRQPRFHRSSTPETVAASISTALLIAEPRPPWPPRHSR